MAGLATTNELWYTVYYWLKTYGSKPNKNFCKQELTTHPDYPALTSVTDFLEMGGMTCSALQADASYIHEFNYPCLLYTSQQYLEEQNIVAIDGVDTRSLVAHVRTSGAMNCILSSEEHDVAKLKAMLDEVPSMDGLELASAVSTQEAYTVGEPNDHLRVAVLDCGVKKNILNCLVERGAYVKAVSYTHLDVYKRQRQEGRPGR